MYKRRWCRVLSKTVYQIGITVSAALLTCCNFSDTSLFTQINSTDSHLSFTNQVVETDSVNLAYNYYFYNGAGVAVCDFNSDGRQDIYLVGNHVPSRLYLNQGELVFQDVSEQAGVLNDYWTSGATFVDINGDNWQDIFVCTVGKGEPNLLYINQGTGQNGISVFKEQAAEYGLADQIISTHAAFLDYDRDNDLDLFVAVNSQLMNNRNETRPRNQKRETQDLFYRNNGDNTFTEISEEVGITNEGYSLGVAVNDINNDGWPDIYVANDFLPNDLLYINNQQGGFEEKASEYLRHASQNGMGVDIADVNQDGFMDITVMDMLPQSNRRRKLMMAPLNYDLFEYRKELGYIPQHVKNTLQINRGPDQAGNFHFSDIGTLAGMYSTDWSWAPLWADFNNSGTLDLFITNGYYKDLTDLDFSSGLKQDLKFGSEEYSYAYQMEALANLRTIKASNFLYENTGEMVLTDISAESGVAEPSFSHGAAFADLDNDGDLDLIVNNLGHEAFLYRNNTLTVQNSEEGNNYLKVTLQGPGKNTNAVGTRLTLFAAGSGQTYYHSPVRGYLSSMSEVIHFGLGSTKTIDSLQIHWPDGSYQVRKNLSANQKVLIKYQPSSKNYQKLNKQQYTFREISDSLGLNYQHVENRFTDFKDNPLLLKMYSREGPALAVGDVNGDQADDIIIGGAAHQKATVFIQKQGKFETRPILEEDSAYEDMGVLLFDIDNDKDLDLYVASGGTDHPHQPQFYEDRLYINTSGKWVRSGDLPADIHSNGTVRGADFDRDGDIDLFAGGKISPDDYPESPTSSLLMNDNGKLIDKTPSALRHAGMISDALWTDFNGDGWLDLIAVGEWTEIMFFVNVKGTLESYTENTGLEFTAGWWNSITSGDYDNDGDTDYVLGNFGLNSYITASPDEPVRLYAEDFNEDGEIDPILSYYTEDDEGVRREFPIHPRDALIDQVIGYKKRFANYLAFAEAGFSDVLRPSDRKDTKVLEATMLTSSLLENLGNGQFAITPLPLEAQVAPAYGMLSQDINGDGNLDIVLTGNQYSAEPVFGNYDASDGLLLIGDGQGEFTPAPSFESGLFLNGDQKGLVNILVNNQPTVVAGANSGPLRAYQYYSGLTTPTEIICLDPLDTFAEITFSDGRKTKREFYYGSTYLSQSSRIMVLYDNMQEIIVHNSQGEGRKIR
ncbi:VCBS repeat-containing protein [Tunicatimonas pelagia]|uniref:VCBS repeat-containing protein n=1 Tax=Tunicatimonas pelagia TaxID=931531 RepID=UPI002666638E|nr:VCBS repeat-containing protein [Tunicatimonas pelagia]WKN44932.1 VCBS repeat-containing protein [Tunicatimonas pelagia]